MAVVATNYATNPRMRQTSGEVVVATNLAERPKNLAGAWSGAGDVNEDGVLLTGANPYTSDVTAQTGDTVSGSVDVWSPDARSLTLGTRGTIDGSFASETFTEWVVDVTPGVQRVTFPDHVLDGGSNGFRLRVSGGAPGVRVNRIMMALGSGRSDYFDGGSEFDGTFTYRWTGTPGASTSERVGQKVSGWTQSRMDLVRATEGAQMFNHEGGSSYSHLGRFPLPAGTEVHAEALFYNPTENPLSATLALYDYGATPTTVNVTESVPPGAEMALRADCVLVGDTNVHMAGDDYLIVRHAMLANSDASYFDGDSRDDRDMDIWINTSESNRRYFWDSTIKDWAPADEAR